MQEDILSGNFSWGTLFPELEETEIPGTAIALEDGEPEIGFLPSELQRLVALGDTWVNNSDANNADGGVVQLIDKEIAETGSGRGGGNGKFTSRFNGVPEEGVGGGDDDDDDDDDGDDGDDGGVSAKEGSDDDDLIIGTTANESMFGKRGEDTLKGNGGKDTLYGGKDDDDCGGGDDGDDIRGDRGKDTCDGGDGDDKVKGGKDNDSLIGGKGNDTCGGDDGDDWVHGKEGDDRAEGGKDKDTLYGGKGNDTCSGDDGNDIVRGDKGNDNCDGGDGDDDVNGGKDNDTLVGGSGNDTCSGDDGDDSVSGGSGTDTLVGGSGNDACSGDDGDDSVTGGSGDDSVTGGSGSDTCVAGDGNDMTDGGGGDDSVVGGGGGDDSLMGNTGNDTIVGGTGNNTCVGGAGNDVFVIDNRTSGGNSVITDYTDGTDKFLLFGDLNFSSLSFVQVGFNAEIRVSGNFVLAVLLNVSAAILEAGDFLGVGGTGNIPGNNNNNNNTSPTPSNSPPQAEANKTLSLGGGTKQTITSDFLRFFDNEQGLSGTVFKITDLPDATTGQLFYNGVAVQAGLTFSQIDISLGLLTFQAAAGFSGTASFGFTVSDGATVVSDQRFSFNVIKTAFNFAGSTVPQVIVGSEFDDSIEGGDADDDIKGGKAQDKIKGGLGKDKIKGDDDDDDIDGGDDDDDVEGGTGNDTVKGGIGNDKLTGSEGDDSIEGGEGTNTLIGGVGRDRFIYRTSRQEITTVAQADLIADFNVDDDVLEFSTAAFANLSVASLTRLAITSTTVIGSIGSANLLDFSADASVTSIATLQARFAALGGSAGPVFCQFTDATTGGSVLVFSIGTRFEVVARFSAVISLRINNFAFNGPPLNVPTGTSGADVFNFGTFPSAVNFSGFAGNDSLSGSNFDDSILGGDGNDFIEGKNGKDKISGGDLNDYLFGDEGDDSITGDGGDDSITGGAGFDVLTGGSGADIFAYSTTKEGGDKITDFTSGTDQFQFVSSAFGNFNSSNFDLVNIADTSTDIAGKELLIFSGTVASLAAVQSQLAVQTGAGTAPVFGLYRNAAGESVLFFDADGKGSGSAVTVANLGTGVTSLGSADFVFTGSIASPTPPPASNSSSVDLSAAGNTFPAGSIDFSTNAGGYGFSSPVLFVGNSGDNKVTGTEFADFMTGAGGADILSGGSGADLLDGGLGADILTGGPGGDIFVYSAPGEGPDTITDFTFGVDKLQFAASVFGNLTTANFDGVSGVAPDITGKELVIFTGGTYASVEAAQASAIGNSTSAGFFAFTNAANETVLVFDSNGTAAGGFTTVANLGTAAGSLGTGDFVFTGSIADSPVATSTNLGSAADLNAAGNTFPIAFNNFGSGAGGYNFTSPVLFTGNSSANSVTATEFADILSGGSGADVFDGGLGEDSLSGDDGDDSLFGGGGSDTLTGGTGNDTLIGGLGTNVLDGGAGADVFVFGGTTAGGGDFITNYSTADDLIALDSDGFAAFTTGPLGSSFYTYSSTAVSVSEIESTLTGPSVIALYDGANTKLYYDANGSTVGGSSLFATVSNVNLGVTGNSELFLF